MFSKKKKKKKYFNNNTEGNLKTDSFIRKDLNRNLFHQ